MDSGTMAQWGAVTISVLALAVAWVNRRTDKIEALDKRLQALSSEVATLPAHDIVESMDRRQDRHDTRLQKVETELAHLPSKDTTHKLELDIARISGQLEVVIESVRPIKEIARRMQDAMLEGNR